MAWIAWIDAHNGFIEIIAMFLILPLLAWLRRVRTAIKQTMADCAKHDKTLTEQAAEMTLMHERFAKKEDVNRVQQDVLRVERQANDNHAETNKTMTKLFERVDKIDRGVARIVGHLCGPDGESA